MLLLMTHWLLCSVYFCIMFVPVRFFLDTVPMLIIFVELLKLHWAQGPRPP